jgi:hypothetical protein
MEIKAVVAYYRIITGILGDKLKETTNTLGALGGKKAKIQIGNLLNKSQN